MIDNIENNHVSNSIFHPRYKANLYNIKVKDIIKTKNEIVTRKYQKPFFPQKIFLNFSVYQVAIYRTIVNNFLSYPFDHPYKILDLSYNLKIAS